jgi:PAS domain S-box-containing protein
LIIEAAQNGIAKDEGWRLRKDGTKFWGSLVITAIHNDQKEVIGFTKVTRDLTDKMEIATTPF